MRCFSSRPQKACVKGEPRPGRSTAKTSFFSSSSVAIHSLKKTRGAVFKREGCGDQVTGVREIASQLVPQFEKATGHKVSITWDRVSNGAKRVSADETADVVFLPSAQMDDSVEAPKFENHISISSVWGLQRDP